MRVVLFVAVVACAACGDDVPPAYCQPCIGEVPAEREDVCMPDE